MFAKPSAGQQISVTTKFTNIMYNDPRPYREDTYVGVVQKDFKWLTNTQFVLSTPEDADMPVRVIDLAYVSDLRIGGEAASSQAVSSRKVLNITGSKGDVYTVTLEGGKASCTCSGFAFRKTCKHIKEIA